MERDPSAESLLRDGRHAYSSRRFKQAAKCFTLAMKRCPCAKGLKRERCLCKNFLQAAETNASIFHEALNTCECSVGKSFGNCDNILHIQALDYRAATFEALQELDRAKKDAEWMLEIAPRCPDGYLRLGKISRLQKKNEFAWKVFNAGIEATLSAGTPKTDPKMKKLYDARQPLHARYFRQDPLQLPLDLVHLIFSYLDLADRMVCLRVCKTWRKGLTNPENRHLWRSFECRRSRGARAIVPPNRVLKKYFSWSGYDVRRVVITWAPPAEDFTKWFEMLLRGTPRLTDFEAPRIPRRNTDKLPHDRWPQSLSRLKLGHIATGNLLKESNSNNFANLTHLELDGLQIFELKGHWPNLRCFSLSGLDGVAVMWNLSLAGMPLLEQLRIEATAMESRPIDDDSLRGPQLKALVFELRDKLNFAGAHVLHRLCSVAGGEHLVFIDASVRHQDNLKALALNHNYTYTQHRQRWDDPGAVLDPTPRNEFTNLRDFRLSEMQTDSHAAEELLEHSLRKGSLRSFDINFELLGWQGSNHAADLKSFSWLDGAESIHNLGVRHFLFAAHSLDEQSALPRFLGSFPNLKTLRIESNHYSPAQLSLVILEIMKAAKALRVIHAPGLYGTALDSLVKEAHTHFGIDVVPAVQSRPWPVVFEEE